MALNFCIYFLSDYFCLRCTIIHWNLPYLVAEKVVANEKLPIVNPVATTIFRAENLEPTLV